MDEEAFPPETKLPALRIPQAVELTPERQVAEGTLPLEEWKKNLLDLYANGVTVYAAARQLGVGKRAAAELLTSEEGKGYLAAYYDEVKPWVKGNVVRAIRNVSELLESEDVETRLRASELILKHFVKAVKTGVEEQAGAEAPLSATKVARELLKQGGVSVNVNISGGAEPPKLLILEQQNDASGS